MQIQVIYSKFKNHSFSYYFIAPKGSEIWLAKFVFFDRLISGSEKIKRILRMFLYFPSKSRLANTWIIHP